MKYLPLLILIPFLLSVEAYGQEFEAKNIDGWRAIPRSAPPYKTFESASLLLVQQKEGFSPTVVMFRVPHTQLPKTKDEWRTLLTEGTGLKPTQEKLVEKNGEVRYFAQFDRQLVPEATTRTAVLGLIVDGEVYNLVYQTYLPIYQESAADIRKLFNEIQIVKKPLK